MSRQKYRANTLPASFPLLSSFGGHSVILPSIDQFYLRKNSEAETNVGIPQVLFMENVMPMTNGLQSIGFDTVVPPAFPDATDFDRAFYLRDSGERKTLYVPGNGKNYYYNSFTRKWRSQPISIPFGCQISVVWIKGIQFVFCSGSETMYQWNGVSLVPIEILGLDLTKILGFVAANTYLVAYTETEVFWSNIIDPTDFVPSLATGAGGTDVLALKGAIVTCSPIADGFLIYTTGNIISATITGNVRFPFVFKELAGSSGIDNHLLVTRDGTFRNQFAYTVSGLQALERMVASSVFPEVTEFLSGRRYEQYNYAEKLIDEINVTDALFVKVNFIAERYLVISYGENELTFALVYDTGLKRWGKIRINHVDCFDFIGRPTTTKIGPGVRYRDLEGSYADQTLRYYQFGHVSSAKPISYHEIPWTYEEIPWTYADFGGIPEAGVFISSGQEPMKSIGFLQKTGEVKLVNFDLPIESDLGVLYLGKYQMSRSRFIDLFEVLLENVSAEKNTDVSVIPSLDGSTLLKAKSLFLDKKNSNGRSRKYLSDISAQNFVIRLEKNFDLNDLVLVFDTAGYV